MREAEETPINYGTWRRNRRVAELGVYLILRAEHPSKAWQASQPRLRRLLHLMAESQWPRGSPDAAGRLGEVERLIKADAASEQIVGQQHVHLAPGFGVFGGAVDPQRDGRVALVGLPASACVGKLGAHIHTGSRLGATMNRPASRTDARGVLCVHSLYVRTTKKPVEMIELAHVP